MPDRAQLAAPGWLRSLQDPAVRTGLFTGLALAGLFIVWLVVANRAPALERFALERNAATAALLLLLAGIPLLRFLRHPARLLVSGITAWAVLSFVYRLLCLFFTNLYARMGAFHVFILGAIAYTIVATICWIVSLLWAARSHQTPHSRHLS